MYPAGHTTFWKVTKLMQGMMPSLNKVREQFQQSEIGVKDPSYEATAEGIGTGTRVGGS